MRSFVHEHVLKRKDVYSREIEGLTKEVCDTYVDVEARTKIRSEELKIQQHKLNILMKTVLK